MLASTPGQPDFNMHYLYTVASYGVKGKRTRKITFSCLPACYGVIFVPCMDVGEETMAAK